MACSEHALHELDKESRVSSNEFVDKETRVSSSDNTGRPLLFPEWADRIEGKDANNSRALNTILV